MQLKVSEKGNAAVGNGISGDLLVLIQEKRHLETFIREATTCTMIYTLVFRKPHLIVKKT